MKRSQFFLFRLVEHVEINGSNLLLTLKGCDCAYNELPADCIIWLQSVLFLGGSFGQILVFIRRHAPKYILQVTQIYFFVAGVNPNTLRRWYFPDLLSII